MEVAEDLHSNILIMDEFLPECIINNLNDLSKRLPFEKARVIDGVNEEIRKTQTYNMVNVGEPSLTIVHWTNLLVFGFDRAIKEYQKRMRIKNDPYRITNVEILKYEKSGFYKFHTDDCEEFHRRYSCIYLLNDNYKGGDLSFKYTKTGKKTIVEKKKNRMIVWPSNFLYPHSVLPIEEGIRYSVVAWAR